jgi:nucleotide-binding universal stress UspA family protein
VRFTNILCPIDHSPVSRGALELAVRLARPGGGRVTLAHAFAERGEDSFRHRLETCQRRLESFAAGVAHEGVTVTARACPGEPAQVILELAREHDAIVMGAVPRSLLGTAVLGSVTQAVLRAARVPVITIGNV